MLCVCVCACVYLLLVGRGRWDKRGSDDRTVARETTHTGVHSVKHKRSWTHHLLYLVPVHQAIRVTAVDSVLPSSRHNKLTAVW